MGKQSKINDINKETEINNLESFLYTLKYDYVVDFYKKDIDTIKNFYNNYPHEVRNNHSFLIVISDILNNLPPEISYNLSKVPLILVPESKYIKESGGYWVTVYDNDYKYIALNINVLESLSKDYYTQEQYHRVLLHEYVHRLIYEGIILEEIIFELWNTKERVSKQSKIDYIENTADSLAIFLMNLGLDGDSDTNTDIKDFKEEFPKTYNILSNWLKEISIYE